MGSAVRSEVSVLYGDSSFEELSDALFQMNALSCATRASVVELVSSLLSRNEWSGDARSVCDWLCMKLGYCRTEARAVEGVASGLSLFPLCFEAFRSGSLSWDRLVILSSFVSTPSEDEYFSRCGYSLSISQLRRIKRAHEDASVSRAKDEEVIEKRFLSLRPSSSENAMTIKGLLPIDDGQLVKRLLEIRTDAIGPDPITGEYPSTSQSMADALVQVFSEMSALCGLRGGSGSASADSSVGDSSVGDSGAGDSGGSSMPGAGGSFGFSDADRATIVVETTVEDFFGDGGGDLEGVAKIGSETLSRLGCDARIQKVEVDSKGNIVGLGRMTRTIPPWLSRRLKKRDQGCRFPGCERTTWVHGHHILSWAKGGPTNLDNMITLCGTHHRFVHEMGWHIVGNPSGAVEFIRPDGKCANGPPPPLRDDVAEMFPMIKTRTSARSDGQARAG
jgi:hypothetical protein